MKSFDYRINWDYLDFAASIGILAGFVLIQTVVQLIGRSMSRNNFLINYDFPLHKWSNLLYSQLLNSILIIPLSDIINNHSRRSSQITVPPIVSILSSWRHTLYDVPIHICANRLKINKFWMGRGAEDTQIGNLNINPLYCSEYLSFSLSWSVDHQTSQTKTWSSLLTALHCPARWLTRTKWPLNCTQRVSSRGQRLRTMEVSGSCNNCINIF